MASVYANGEQVPNGKTVMTDHSVQTFTVVLRSNIGVSESVLQRAIENYYEVIRIQESAERLHIVQ